MTLRRTMEIYLLTPIEEARHAHDDWQVDGTAERIVLRASGPAAARRLAQREAQDRGDLHPETWLDAQLTSCQRLGDDGPCGVLVVERVG